MGPGKSAKCVSDYHLDFVRSLKCFAKNARDVTEHWTDKAPMLAHCALWSGLGWFSLSLSLSLSLSFGW